MPATALARLIWATVAFLVHLPLALAQADQLELSALVQEGDLILEEAAALAPATEKLTKERQQIAASDKALRADIQALEASIKQFNASTEELTEGAKQYEAQCPRRIEDRALWEPCNARGAELNELAGRLDARRPTIEAQQKEVNARIDLQNAAGEDYAKRKREHDSRDRLNQQDAEDWLGRARAFLASESFHAFLVRAGDPLACGPDRIAAVASARWTAALKRAHDCLKAVRAGVR
jgi:uncharacterized protein (DUF3084 family)